MAGFDSSESGYVTSESGVFSITWESYDERRVLCTHVWFKHLTVIVAFIKYSRFEQAS